MNNWQRFSPFDRFSFASVNFFLVQLSLLSIYLFIGGIGV
jgi:hypothetical protein